MINIEILKLVLSIFWQFWPIWGLVFLILLVNLIFKLLEGEIIKWRIRKDFKKAEQWLNDRQLIQWLRSMKPTEFEIYIADLFRRLGYETQQVGGSHDGGIDVIAKKDNKIHFIQCKKYFSRHEVGSPEIRDFYGALAGRLADGKGWFITTNKFTLEAENFAEDKPIELIDQFDLIKYIRLAEKEEPKMQTPIPNSVCPQCGGVLSLKNGKFGKFWGCSNYPKCKYSSSVGSE